MVYFVGAGCGAPDLITVRGMHLLERADVIIYAGSLVNPRLLEYAREGCEIYNSAKMTLDEVIAVMKQAEKENKMTVRLHTGDQSVYGAVREQMESFAAHEATMAIYLSTGMLGELSRRLIAGGYRAETPAALVYKATWPEEEAYLCKVGELEQTASEHGITKTALVLVGEVLAHQNYQKSRLYAPDFSTEFRQAKEETCKE